MWALRGHFEQPTVLDLTMMFVLILGPLFAGISMTAVIQQRRIAPILSGAPTTQETITNRDIIKGNTAAPKAAAALMTELNRYSSRK